MKNCSFFLIILWLFSACSGPGEEAPATFLEASVTEKVEIDAEHMPFKGEAIKTLRWQDKAGQQTLILADRPAYSVDDDLSRTEFYGYLYREAGDRIDLVWQFEDVLDSCWCDCAIDLVDGHVYLKDINGDGAAEPYFLLFLNDLCDVSPMPARLRLFSEGKALQVDGWMNVYLDEGLVLPPGQVSGALEGDSLLASFALEQWNAFVSEKKRQLRDKERASEGASPMDED